LRTNPWNFCTPAAPVRKHGRLDVLDSGIAGLIHHLRYLRIHRDHLIAPFSQPFKKGRTEILRIAGDSDHGDTLLGEKILNGFEGGEADGHILLRSFALAYASYKKQAVTGITTRELA
jgi:hypothetical protein